jgi:tetratricopeptide (TPR) repeat protein
MKKQPYRFIWIFALIAVMCSAITSCSQPAVVTKSEIRENETKAAGFKELREIRIDRTPEEEEKVTFVLNGFYPPKTFVSEEDQPKIICDFPETRMSESIKPTTEVDGKYLKRIRLEIQEGTPSKLRAVMEMTLNHNYSIKQTFFKRENRYTLTFTPKGNEKTKQPDQQTVKPDAAAKNEIEIEEAKQLNQQTMNLIKQGRFAEAVPIAQKALSIREKVFGAEHPDTATSLNSLAELYRELREYSKAEPLYKRALQICEKTLGTEHPDTATILNNLAGLYGMIGDYAKAEPLYKRALQICEKTLGAEHPHTATILNNLAELYGTIGDYAKAEPLHKRALQIREKALGPEHSDTALSLNNLAGLYYHIGDYAKAEPLLKRALQIREKALGLGSVDISALI